MNWMIVPAMAIFVLVSAGVKANVVNLTTDANGTLTQVFFDEAGLSEADEAAHIGFFGPGSYDAFFLSAQIPMLDFSTVLLLKPGSTPAHPVISDVVRIEHTFSHGDGRTEVHMVFISDIDGTPISCLVFGCGDPGTVFVMETGGIQDITSLFPFFGLPGTLPFTVLVRSDVPEPPTLVLAVLGLAALGLSRRRLRSQRGS